MQPQLQLRKLSAVFHKRRFMMANIEKIAKNMMHDVADGKAILQESLTAYLRNQQIIIAQNKHIIDTLECINQKINEPPVE
jgi:hypothetical protein